MKITTKPKNEKQCAVLAWKTAVGTQKLTPILRAIGGAIHTSKHSNDTFSYAHALSQFSRKIASPVKHISLATLDYNLWRGRWYVSNYDLDIYATFEMWFHRYAPESAGCGTSRIAKALKHKRMQQAYDRYQETKLTHNHCILAAAALWEIDTSRGDWVSLFVQGKRPFGDSSKAAQIHSLLGWPQPWLKKDRSLNETESERAWNIFDELAFAMPDIARLAQKTLKKLRRYSREAA